MLSKRPWLVPLLSGLWALIISAVPCLVGNHPQPNVHDEFSYLLAADTFAHGRLANPTHPMWQHFETFHEIFQPTYASKFPPGQGLTLAAGELLGDPMIGVWVTMALACAALAWAIQGWLPDVWALLAGLITPLLAQVHWWSQTYWGTGLAMLGGALLIGAMIRCIRRPTIRNGIIAALGIVILANTRPLEGLILCILIAILVLGRAKRLQSRAYWQHLLMRFGVAGVVTVTPFVGMMAYYNWRVTGNALALPYAVHTQQYMASPLFFWQMPPVQPDYRHAVLRDFHTAFEFNEYQQQVHGIRAWRICAGTKLKGLISDHLNPIVIVIPILLSLLTWRHLATRFALFVVIFLPAIHLLITPWVRAQYMAPIVPCWALLIAMGCWKLSRIRYGQILVGGFVAAFLFFGFVNVVEYSHLVNQSSGYRRAHYIEQLKAEPGDHLLLIDYAPGHSTLDEWVYNDADIDHSRVILAHDMGPLRDRELIDYYPNRKVWRVRISDHGRQIDRVEVPR